MPALVILVVVVLAIWGVMLLFQGVAWFLAATVALFTVPSIAALRPLYWLLESGDFARDVLDILYVVAHAALGAYLGWLIGTRVAGDAGSDAPWPGRDSQRRRHWPVPGGNGNGIALPELPWDVRLQNNAASIFRRLRAVYELHPGWVWGIGVAFCLFFGPLLIALVMLTWPLLLIGGAVLGAMIYRSRRSRSL